MNIQIDGTCPMPIVSTIDFMVAARSWCPDLKIKDGSPIDIQRVVKKMIKERNTFLYVHSMLFNTDIPLFLIDDINKIFNKKICKMSVLNIENLSFESNSAFTSKDELALSSLFKKVKTTLKENEFQDWDKMRYFLPTSTIVNSTIILTYIEIYKFLSYVNSNKNIKLRELGRMMFRILTDKFPDIFNEYNLQIYEASKEN